VVSMIQMRFKTGRSINGVLLVMEPAKNAMGWPIEDSLIWAFTMSPIGNRSETHESLGSIRSCLCSTTASGKIAGAVIALACTISRLNEISEALYGLNPGPIGDPSETTRAPVGKKAQSKLTRFPPHQKEEVSHPEAVVEAPIQDVVDPTMTTPEAPAGVAEAPTAVLEVVEIPNPHHFHLRNWQRS
jgi:hypothetical protein